MSQAAAAAPTGALTVVTIDSPVMAGLKSQEIQTLLNRYLAKSNPALHAVDLLWDLAQQMTLVPDLQVCTPQSLMNTLLFAAKLGATFGIGGVWAVPYNGQATPQMDYRLMEKVAEMRHDLKMPLTVEFVYPGDEFEDTRENGVVTAITHKVDWSNDRDKDDFILGYATGEYKAGGRWFLIMTKAQLAHLRAVSPATGAQSPWQKFTIAMYRKTLIRAAMRMLVPDFMVGLGGMELPEGVGEPRDVTDEVNAASRPRLTQTQKLQQDLQKQAGVDAPEAAKTAPQPQEKAQPAAAQAAADSPFGGYSASQEDEIILAIATKGAEAKDKKSLKVLMDWWKGEWPKWQKKGTAAQCEAFIKVRDETLATLQKEGIK